MKQLTAGSKPEFAVPGEQQDAERLLQQQQELQSYRNYDYANDPAYYTPPQYRSLDGKANHVLSQDLARQMVTAGKGGLGTWVRDWWLRRRSNV